MAFLEHNNYLFACEPGVIYRSADSATSWEPIFNPDTTFSIITMPNSNIMIGTSNGVYISSNNGVSWTASNTGLTNDKVLSLVVSGTKILAGTRAGVFSSNNNGSTWAGSNIGMSITKINSLSLSASKVLACTNIGLYTSTNSGLTWSSMSGLPYSKVLSAVILGNAAVVACDNGTVYKNLNIGSSTWTQVFIADNVTTLAIYGSQILCFSSKIISSYYQLYLSSNDTAKTFIHNNGYNYITTGGPGSDLKRVNSTFKSGQTLYNYGKDGIMKTTDQGQTWKFLGLGYANDVYKILKHKGKLFVATADGLFISSNNGEIWEKRLSTYSGRNTPPNYFRELDYYNYSNKISGYTTLAANDSMIFYVAAEEMAGWDPRHNIHKSINAGSNWNKYATDSLGYYQNAYNFNISVTDSILHCVAETSSREYASFDLKMNTIQPVQFSVYPDEEVRSITSSGPLVFIVNQTTYDSTNIAMSSDNGFNWSNVNLPIKKNWDLGSTGANIYAYCDSTIAISNDYGSSWFSTEIPNCSIITSITGKDNEILAGAKNQAGQAAVFYSSDNGLTWQELSNGIDDCVKIGAVCIDDSLFYAGQVQHGCTNHRNGVFKFPRSSLTGLKLTKSKGFKLGIYPLPAHTELNIAGLKGHIGTIYFMDLNGKSLKEIPLSTKVDISLLTTGTYLMRVVTKELDQTNKIIISR